MTDQAAPPGIVLGGRYEVLGPLGQGSFGHTYAARDRETGNRVALKRLSGRGADDWKARELFDREAAVLRSLRHHGIPQVHEVLHESWDGLAVSVLVMDLVDGVPLSRIIDERRPLDAADVMHLVLELLGILEYLHGRVPSILHRDIKPANVLLRADGTPALVDFGSVRNTYLAPDESGSTVAGTYGYMPYEQYMGQASASSDLYALAATILHLVTGRAPREFMNAEGRIEVPATLPGDPRLRDVLARALRASPPERFAGAADMRRALLTPAGWSPGESMAVRAPAAIAPQRIAPAIALGPTPRAIEGSVRAELDRLSPGALEFMDSSSKSSDEPSLLDLAGVAFFSVVTIGVLPLVFTSMSRERRRRIRRFLVDGEPATAEILGIESEKIAFDGRIARVTYQFEADGQKHRDTDVVRPRVASRWQPGDRLQVLYLAAHDYDSVIITAG